ncbi:beta-propeller domain-containing protein [Nocardioides pacificus]
MPADESTSPTPTPRPGQRGRLAIAGVSVLAVVGAFLAGTQVDDPDDGRADGRADASGASTDSSAAGESIDRADDSYDAGAGWRAQTTGALTGASSCDDVLAAYVERGVDLVGPWGWEMEYGILELGFGRDAMAGARAESPAMQKATSSATGTNVQEQGVDEPDVAKTDGELLVRVEDDHLTTYDVAGRKVQQLGRLPLADIVEARVLLVGDEALVVGADEAGYWEDPRTRTLRVDLSDPAAPVVVDERVYDSALVEARQHGEVVRLVLQSGLPDLDFVGARGGRSKEQAVRRNRAIVRATTIDDWLPTVTIEEGQGSARTDLLAQCEDVGLPDEGGLGTLAVVATDLAAGADDPGSATAIATDSRVAYVGADRIFVATTTWSWFGRPAARRAADEGVSDVHSFALDGTRTTYVASGEVDGAIADRWAMDHHDGTLRLAVGRTSATGDFNSVVTLEERGDQLVEVGRLDKLGIGEDIQSVRWFADLAVLVTYRQIDPLYAVDLSDATRPRKLGELKMPGFSDYLHPLGPTRMIGMGVAGDARGRTRGGQAALFNLTDLTNPRKASQVEYGPRSQAMAGQDPRQFTWLPESRTALTVVSRGWTGRTGWVSVLRPVDGTLHNRMVEVEHGHDVDRVRLLPLPDGRVLLVTGDGARFFRV